jgi:hypothetical protein
LADDEPVYLEFADALELYAAIIGATVTQAGDQLRNRSGLESALARPRSYARYEDADLALQAAVLSHGIAESKPSWTVAVGKYFGRLSFGPFTSVSVEVVLSVSGNVVIEPDRSLCCSLEDP